MSIEALGRPRIASMQSPVRICPSGKSCARDTLNCGARARTRSFSITCTICPPLPPDLSTGCESLGTPRQVRSCEDSSQNMVNNRSMAGERNESPTASGASRIQRDSRCSSVAAKTRGPKIFSGRRKSRVDPGHLDPKHPTSAGPMPHPAPRQTASLRLSDRASRPCLADHNSRRALRRDRKPPARPARPRPQPC